GAARSYAIEGAVASDTCGGRVVLVAQNILISQGNQWLEADVVRRRYQARHRPGGPLVFEGYFREEGSAACAGSTLFERWTLHLEGADGLVGELSSGWRLAPRCDQPCTVT